ncbi:SART-1 protein [Basidiobolus meristosporus CBS 931.73]|uniref:SART-1 protein n=1 Tax=Basidiobolus meristosporus CBS 931.73 TaxID=1314790 RepID=A0A1Y1Y9M4_9FUNG|nr:SART-1 protein [Basidiobolus meristosporus CBS 931.73]|eukprot:ORX94711.1 SART-1 protein [Basidiobolus meristosporus CBS 931.73]
MDEDRSGGESSLSFEETNKLRISLGLKPLEPGKGSTKDRAAEENYTKYQEEQAAKSATQEVKARIEKRKLNEKLSGQGLGDEADVDDTLDWVKKSRQREKELAKKRMQELNNLDAELEQSAKVKYSGDSLSGMKVAHNLGDFESGEVILTLKDSNILEENGDELSNIQLEEQEKLRQNIENKKKRPIYTGYDDEEFQGDIGQKRSILSHYDEEIDGPKKDFFVLNSKGEASLDREREREEVAAKLKSQAVTLSFEKMNEIQDYYTAEEVEVTFKKPKKKKKKSSRRKADLGFLDDSNEKNKQEADMELDSNTPATSTTNRYTNQDEANFVDDEDLQQALARARRLAVKKQKRSIEEVAKAVLETNEAVADDSQGGLIIDDTSEFVKNLGSIPTLPINPTGVQHRERAASPQPISAPQADSMEIDAAVDSTAETPAVKEQSVAIVEEEPLVSSGLAATLALLQQKGIYEGMTEEQKEREKIQRERQRWISEQRTQSSGSSSRRERSPSRSRDRYSRDRSRSRDRRRDVDDEWKRFENYKPDVHLEYSDEFGNPANQKEAFRAQSHKFHGKSSGKLKVEKRMKKMEEAKKTLAML